VKKHYFWTSVAAALLGVATIGVLAYGLGAPSATLLGPALVRDRFLPGGPRQIALTFDDGPAEPYTSQILDILRANHVRATFFLCGSAAERYPDLVRRIKAEGHEIGNHTYSHPWLYLKDKATIAAEIDRTQEVLQRISGDRPRLFRPPYGVRWFSLWPILQERGLTMVLWSMRGTDGGLGAEGLARTSLEQLQPGGILLLHDGFEARPAAQVDRSDTVRALPAIIAGARRAGYSFALLPGA
jgi:peptidoglycan-N-acetylglucosamine deacetylase